MLSGRCSGQGEPARLAGLVRPLGGQGRHGSGLARACLAAPTVAPTSGAAVAAADNDVTPSPARTQARCGSAAASPHTPTGLPTARPAAATTR